MTETSAAHDDLFGALCNELGICLHAKGQAKVVAALPAGLDAAVKAVFEAEGIDLLAAPGALKRQVRDCIKTHQSPIG